MKIYYTIKNGFTSWLYINEFSIMPVIHLIPKTTIIDSNNSPLTSFGTGHQMIGSVIKKIAVIEFLCFRIEYNLYKEVPR